MTLFEIITWAAFVLTQLADIITTRKALKQGGVELNPFVAFLMDKLGSKWWVIKLLISFVGAFILHYAGSTWAIALLAGVVGLVAINNWRHLK